MARNLNGSSQSMSAAADLSAHSKGALAYWIDIDSLSTTLKIFHEYTSDGQATTGGFHCYYDPSSPGLLFVACGGAGLSSFKRYNGVLTTGRHHILCTYEFNVNPEVALYLDGSEPTVSTSRNVLHANNFANSTLYIGARTNSSLWTDARYSDIAWWGGVIPSADQITALAAGTSPLAVLPPTRYWRATGNGTTEIDMMGGAAMSLTGSPSAAESYPVFYGGVWPANYTPAAVGATTGILRNQTRAIERGYSGVAAAQLGGVLA